MLTNQEKMILAERERKNWEAEQYQLELRGRIHNKLGADDLYEQTAKQLEQVQKTIDAINEEIKRLQTTKK